MVRLPQRRRDVVHVPQDLREDDAVVGTVGGRWRGFTQVAVDGGVGVGGVDVEHVGARGPLPSEKAGLVVAQDL